MRWLVWMAKQQRRLSSTPSASETMAPSWLTMVWTDSGPCGAIFYRSRIELSRTNKLLINSTNHFCHFRKLSRPSTFQFCLFIYFFNLFAKQWKSLFGLITFDPFYKANNTLIILLHALAAVQHDFGHSQCFANRTRRQSRLVRFATLKMSSMYVALPLNAWRNVYY